MIKSRGIGSIGGAMDLVSGAKNVIVTMEHVTKNNDYKITNHKNFITYVSLSLSIPK